MGKPSCSYLKPENLRNYLCLILCTWFLNLAATAQNSSSAKVADKWVYFSLRPGMSVDYLQTDGYQAENIEYKPSTQFIISAAVDIDNPEMNGFVVRGEVTHRYQHFQGEGYEDRWGFLKREFIFRTLTPDVSLLYKVPLKSKLQIYGGGGVGWNIRKIEKNVEIEFSRGEPFSRSKAFHFTDQEWSLSLSAGVIYKSRFEWRAKYFKSEISNATLYTIKAKSLTFSVTYRF